MPNELYNEKENNIKEYLTENMINIEQNLEENFIYSFGNYYPIILKLYNIITNTYFRIAILLTCIIIIIGLVIIEKNKSLRTIQISSMITVIYTIIVFIVVKLFFNFIDQKLAGGWLSNINLSLMIIFIIIEIIISLTLFIIRKNLKCNNDN